MNSDSIAQTFRSFIRRQSALLGAAGWITAAYILQQFLRIATSVALAWLLAPELLGVMLLINTLRTGGELLTDIGVGQSIINNPDGDNPHFYNTAWTLQVLRGAALLFAVSALSLPLAHFYGNPKLSVLLPITSISFFVGGLTSPARFIIQRRMGLKRLAIFDAATYLITAITQIGLAAITPTIWALVIGLLVAVGVQSGASYALLAERMPAFVWDRKAAHSIIHFGKWIFASSLIYFAALNFDRLYFAKVISISMLGVYGIARSYVDSILLLFQRLANLIVFPKVSVAQLDSQELRARILPLRLGTTLFTAIGLALVVAVSDQFILLAYDARYSSAALFLPILLVGAWFAILAVFSDAIMMGIGKPSSSAWANAAKLLFVVSVVPQILPREGMIGAVVMFAFAEIVRYGVLTWRSWRNGLSFVRQDALTTLVFFGSILLFREIAATVDLGHGFASWGT